ncbi:MAG: TatD family hydrolase, partial [Ureaplasma sp.]|nr:TatD family hydrolase [Ureaplasma sp.]
AKEFQRLGCYISVGGIVTFKNGEVLKDVVRNVDLNLVVTETDAPYLAPTPFRGNTNFPYYVKYVNEFIARVLNMDLDKFNNHMMSNIKKLFRL